MALLSASLPQISTGRPRSLASSAPPVIPQLRRRLHLERDELAQGEIETALARIVSATESRVMAELTGTLAK